MGRAWAGAVVPLALVGLSFALYAPSFGNPLIWDDEIQVAQARAAGLRTIAAREEGQYRRPLLLLSYRLQLALGLGTPGWFHLVNALLHGVNAALLFLVLCRLGLTACASGAASAVFLAHPLQSAAVAYVSGRTDLLAVVFTLAALCLTFAAVTPERSRSLWLPLAVAAAVMLAATAKESGLVAGPLVAALWCVVARGDQWRRPVLPIAALLATALTAVWVHPPALAAAMQLDALTRLRAVGTTVLTDARLLVAPMNLHLDRLTPSGHALSVAVGGAAVGLAAWVSIRILARPREITARRFGLLALALTYAPVSNLVPVYPAIADRWVFTPEHFLYAPIAVSSAFAAGGVSRLWSRMLPERLRAGDVAVAVAAAIVVLVSIVPVRLRQARLADAETVYRDTLAHSPSPRACFNLGVTLLTGERYTEAVEIYERCAMISPGDGGVYAQLGVAYQQAGRPAEAAMAYERAVSLDPRNALAWSNYASLDAQSGAYEAARAKWRKALDLDDSFLPARRGLEQLDRLGSSE